MLEDVNLARFLRCTTDINKLIHAYRKGLGEGQNRYGKGFGEQKRAMLKEECGNELYMATWRFSAQTKALGWTRRPTQHSKCTTTASTTSERWGLQCTQRATSCATTCSSC